MLIQHEKLDEVQITIAAVISKKSDHPLEKVINDQKKYPNWEVLSRYYHFDS